MRWAIGVALLALALAGCTKTVEEMSYSERQALGKQIAMRCIDQGVKPGTKQMEDCTFAESQREVATRRRQAAIEDARRSSGPTVCNRIGYTVICN